MAVDKLVDSTQLDTDLTSVANAIRTKGGTSASLAFPDGFVSAVNAIPTGGGGGDPIYGLLQSIEITEDVSLITISLSDLVKQDGKLFLSFDNVTFSAKDYLYIRTGTSSSSKAIYRASATSANFTCQLLFSHNRTFDGKTFAGFFDSFPSWTRGSGGATPTLVNSPNNFYIMLYSSSTTFTSGTISVYGRVS